MTPVITQFWCVLCRDFRTEIHFRGFGGHNKGEPEDVVVGKIIHDLLSLQDALRAIAGETDSCGYSHLSTLHDIGKVIEFASRVLRGEDPHAVLGAL